MSSAFLKKAVFYTAKAFIVPYIRFKYGFRTDYVPDINEPFIILSNHTTEDDMFFTGIASRGYLVFVCGEHLLRNKTYGKPLRVLVDPIPLPKGGASLQAVREILKRVSDGYNICMFPEGKRSFHGETIPSPVSLGKLVKKAGCALVTYRIRGGYFTYPRWARDHLRKGHVEGKVVGVYTSEQLRAMTAQEVTDIINRDTYENAYEVQREKHWEYKGKDLAKGMEHVMFICPCCGSMDTIRTDGDGFSCVSCGMSGIYDTQGFLRSRDLPFDNVHSWMRWIETEYDRFVSEHQPDETLFTEDDVLLYHMLDGYQNEDVLRGPLQVTAEQMSIGGFTFRFEDISELSILFGNILLFTYKGVYYGLTGDAFHAWKCGRLWHLKKGDTDDKTKEM